MDKRLLNSKELNLSFSKLNYRCVKPYPIINNNDTVFVSAGIQPLLLDYRKGLVKNGEKLYVSQPVIRTQYANSIEEGSSIAFTNLTTSSFNHSESEHNMLLNDWYDIFAMVGLNKKEIAIKSDIFETNWGDLKLEGKRTFHYYKGVEIGDTTFFTNIVDENSKVIADSMSDLGFGLERLRWLINDNNSYYNLYSDSINLDINLKAYLSAIALLTINNIKPSNKNSGYRFRLFSKKIINMLQGRELNEQEEDYLDECIAYWQEWQEASGVINKQVINDEFIRNGNRFIIDKLSSLGYQNLDRININISRNELENRLITSGVEKEMVRKLVR